MTRRTVEGIHPLTPMQQGLLFHTLYAPDSGEYVLQLSCCLTGRLNLHVFERAWQEVVARHSTLRTSFVWKRQREPVQVVNGEVKVSIELEDWRDRGDAEREELLERYLRADRARGFELEKAPLMRIALMRTGEIRHELVWTSHHLLMDGWSLPLVLKDVFTCYGALSEGRQPRFEQSQQFGVYVEWLRQQDLKKAENYWRGRLKGFRRPTAIDLGRVDEVEEYGRETLRLSAEATARFGDLCRREHLTLSTLTQGAWALLLSRYAGENDVVYGATVSGRPADLPGVETVVGLFINTLPVRVAVDGGRLVRDWLNALQAQQAEMREYEYSPLAEVKGWSEVEQGMALFESVFAFDNYPVKTELDDRLPVEMSEGDGAAARLKVDRVRTREQTNYPLTVNVAPGSSLAITISYDGKRFKATSIRRMLDHYARLLQGMVARPEQRITEVHMLSKEEISELASESGYQDNDSLKRDTLHDLFEVQVGRSPDRVAIVSDDAHLSYFELDRSANRTAHYLRSVGAGPECRVGVSMERTAEMIVAVLAILKSGAAYVPLDPAYPDERLRFVIEDAGLGLVVTRGSPLLLSSRADLTSVDISSEPVGGQSDERPLSGAIGQNLAYIIYTSGSTGRPKGVAICHEQVVRLFAATEQWYGFDSGDVWTLFHSYAFDFSVWEIWGALLYGGRLVVVPYPLSRSPHDFYRSLCDQQVTVLNQTPSAFRQLAQAEEEMGAAADLALEWVIFGGEALELNGLKPWFLRHGDCRPRLVNMYGITETTVHVTYRPLTAADSEGAERSLIGRAIPDLAVYLVDRDMQLVPIELAGEIYVGGEGLARCYLGNAQMTAERFVPNPFSKRPGARLYRTGDLGRRLPDGDIDYRGRIDHQVKIRGFRIELGEVEMNLLGHPSVEDAIVLAESNGSAENRLIAYIRSDHSRAASANELRGFLKQRIPDYMIPAAFVSLPSFPLTPSGKVDRLALRRSDRARPEIGTAYAAPVTEVERMLAEVWAEALGVSIVGVDEGFFELGGDSIRTIQVLARVKKHGFTFPIQQLFRHQTIRELASYVERDVADEKHRSRPFSMLSRDDHARLPDGLEDAYPLAMMQAGMLFHSDYAPESAEYHNVSSFHVRAPLAVGALREAIRQLISRHPVLRTSFDLVGFSQPLQLVHRVVETPLEVTDLAGLSPARQEEALDRWIEGEKWKRFDWSRPPLLRFYVHRRSDEAFQFAMAEHHAILDGWSVASLLAELFQIYLSILDKGVSRPEPSPPNLFREFIALEREALESEGCKKYWRDQLSELTASKLPRPSSRPDPGAPARTHVTPVRISRQVSRALTELAGTMRVPVKTLMLAAHLRVLALIVGELDVVTGVVTHGRPEEVGGERALGLFLNSAPFRLKLGRGTWADLIRETFDAERALAPHRHYPIAQLQIDEGGRQLFEVLFNFMNFHVLKVIEQSNEIQVVDEATFVETNFTMVVDVRVEGSSSGVTMSLTGKTDDLSGEQLQAWSGYYERTLATLTGDVNASYLHCNLLSDQEVHQLLIEWNGAERDYPGPKTLSELVERQVDRTQDRVAVVCDESHLTYGTLNNRADKLASCLWSSGLGPESRVAVSLERSLEMVIGLLGALKAGCAYVPMDPTYPSARLGYMLKDTEAAALLTQERMVEGLPSYTGKLICLDGNSWSAGRSTREAGPVVSPRGLAYVIYTSGSTGRPKGAMNAHDGIANRLLWMQEAYEMEERDRVLQKTTFSFDVSVWELFWPLLTGAALVMAGEGAHRDVRYIRELIQRERITTLHFVPSMLASFLEDEGWVGCESVTRVISSGEALSANLVRRFYERGGRGLNNLYGPTEAAVDVTWRGCARDEGLSNVPIGRPIANTRIYVVDKCAGLAPPGTPGELLIGGVAVGRGYWNRAARTAESFVPDGISGREGERLYRTGDLARWRRDGELEYLDRIDGQIKLCGRRIELGEIESVLEKHSAVRQCAVCLRESESGDKRLVAYVVPDPRDHSRSGSVAESDRNQVSQWQFVFDETYGSVSPDIDPRFNAVGWNSSYTGQPIPVEEMREWLDRTIERIVSLKPKRALEIGCGTGMVLFRVASFCDEYCATDISPVALEGLRKAMTDQAGSMPQLTLLERAADDFRGIKERSFDLVILNSVIQYFPSGDYLFDVLEKAVGAVTDCGSIFIGDVRNFSLLDALHASVELHKAPAPLSVASLKQQIHRDVSMERELVVSPEFFIEVKRRLPRIGRVEIQLKRGSLLNELNRFRYDVILRVGSQAKAGRTATALDWRTGELTLRKLRHLLLEERPERLVVTRAPNSRLQSVMRLLNLLLSDTVGTVGELQERMFQEGDQDGFDPEDAWKLGEETGYSVEVCWAGAANKGHIDLLFSRQESTEYGALAELTLQRRGVSLGDLRDYVNTPALTGIVSRMVEEFRTYLKENLPEYMVPSAFVEMARLPATPNGKLDRKALPALCAEEAQLGGVTEGERPRTVVEEMLAGIWCQVLGLGDVGPNRDFFELGGHSLLATQVISRVRDVLGTEVPFRALFDNPTLTRFAEAVEGRLRAKNGVEAPPIRAAGREEDLPLSFAQQRLWFIHELEPNGCAYNIPYSVRLNGPLDVSALRQSLTEIVRRHEVLRTTFMARNGQTLQVIAGPGEAGVALWDLCELAEGERELHARSIVGSAAARPFDLGRSAWRAALVRIGREEHVLIICMHHVVSDGWSTGLLINEFTALYEACRAGLRADLPELTVQYADVAVWQREWLQGEVLDNQLDYWRRELAGLRDLELPADRPRSGITSHRGAELPFMLSPELTRELKALGRREGVTLFMTVLAAFQIALSRYSGQSDFAVGTDVANRNRLETEALIGFFVNQLVLRTDLSGDPTVTELLGRVREATLGAYAHQDVPFEKLVQALAPQRELSRSPLFQVKLVLQNAPRGRLRVGGIEIGGFGDNQGLVKRDLTLFLTEDRETVSGTAEYAADLYEKPSIERLLGLFHLVLKGMTSDPRRRVSDILLTTEDHDLRVLRQVEVQAFNVGRRRAVNLQN